MPTADYQAFINREGQPITLAGGGTVRAIRNSRRMVSGGMPEIGAGQIVTVVEFHFGPDADGLISVNDVITDRRGAQYRVLDLDPIEEADALLSLVASTDPTGR